MRKALIPIPLAIASRAAVATAAFVLSATTVLAATRTWNGAGTNNNWTTAGNWGGVAPVPGDDLVFASGAARLSNTNNFPAGTSFNSIAFAGGNYQLDGSNVLLNAGITATNTSGDNVILFSVTLNSNQAITSGSAGVNLYLYGAIDNNGKDLTLAGNGTAQVAGTLSGSGGLIKTGNGTAQLYASNTFSGAVQITQGAVAAWDDYALGSASGNTTISSDGLLILESPSLAEPLVVAGNLLSLRGLPTAINVPLLLSSNATIQVNLQSPLTINASISGPGGLTNTGSGLLTLNGTHSYTGTTTAGGNLVVNGTLTNSPIVLSGGALSGTGTVATITASGAFASYLSPGQTTPGPTGILTASNVTLNPATFFRVRLSGAAPGDGYDQLQVRGTMALSNALLSASQGFAASVGQSFTIIENQGANPVMGTFSGLPEGKVFVAGTNVYQISYQGGTGNDVVLTVVQTGVARTWTGAGANAYWANETNWLYNVAPNSSDDLVFPPGAARLVNTNNYPAGTRFNSITISGTNYNLNGASIFLDAGINATNATDQNYWLLPITLNANQTITTGNPGVNLYLNGAITNNGKDLTFAGNGYAQLGGAVSGAGGLMNTGNNTLFLYASNSFSGPIQILAGNVAVWHNSALGSTAAGTTVATGGQLSIGSALLTLSEPLVLAGVLSAGGPANVWTGPITLTGTNASISTVLNAVFMINASISGTGSLAKTSLGTLVLNSNNTYTGTTTVKAGTLQVNGSQPASPFVLNGGYLTGTGTVGTITAIGNFTSTIAPGRTGTGILSSSNLTLNSATTLMMDLNGNTPGSGYDQLNVAGTVTLANATLSIALGFAPTNGSAFTLIINDGADAVVGPFAGLPAGAYFTNGAAVFRISYTGGDGNDVVLYRVYPPPQFASITRLTNDWIQLQAAGVSNLTYTIQASTNLVNWSNLASVPANTAGLFSYTDTNTALFPRRFYRALSP